MTFAQTTFEQMLLAQMTFEQMTFEQMTSIRVVCKNALPSPENKNKFSCLPSGKLVPEGRRE